MNDSIDTALHLYVLDGKTAKPVHSVIEWGIAFQCTDRTVVKSNSFGVHISTVFLGVDHNFNPFGPPLLFETLVFADPHCKWEGWMIRTPTYESAEDIHKMVYKRIRYEQFEKIGLSIALLAACLAAALSY